MTGEYAWAEQAMPSRNWLLHVVIDGGITSYFGADVDNMFVALCLGSVMSHISIRVVAHIVPTIMAYTVALSYNQDLMTTWPLDA